MRVYNLANKNNNKNTRKKNKLLCLNNSQCNLMMFSTATMKTTDRQRYFVGIYHEQMYNVHACTKTYTLADMNENKVNICLRIEFQMCHFQDSSNFQFNNFVLRTTNNEYSRFVLNTTYIPFGEKKRATNQNERWFMCHQNPYHSLLFYSHLTNATITRMNRHVHIFPDIHIYLFLSLFSIWLCFFFPSPNERFCVSQIQKMG